MVKIRPIHPKLLLLHPTGSNKYVIWQLAGHEGHSYLYFQSNFLQTDSISGPQIHKADQNDSAQFFTPAAHRRFPGHCVAWVGDALSAHDGWRHGLCS
jgi:hypothetical protein